MTAITDPFQELALVSIQAKGGTAYQFAGIIDEISPSIGDRDIEGKPLINGGRIVKKTPQTDHELKLKIYPTSINMIDGSDLIQGFFDVDANWDDTEPLSSTNTHNQEIFQVCVAWCNDKTKMLTANGTSTLGTQARRIILKEARMTSYKDSFDDMLVSAEVTFKAPAFDINGTGTLTYQSNEEGGSTALVSVTAYI